MKNFPKIKIEKFRKIYIFFLIIFFSGFAFLSLAQENSSTKNIFLDSDQDGLSDEEEKTYGTDPKTADTDNDGYSDGVEIKSGYNPLKPSPNDKIVPATKKENSAINSENEEQNLTKKMAQDILVLAENSQKEGEEIDLAMVQLMVEEAINPTTSFEQDENQEGAEEENSENSESESTNEIPLISPDEIKIKDQNYGEFSEKKQKEKKKEDVVEYLAAIYYVIASNAPEPITSGNGANSIINLATQQLTQAFTQRSTEKIEDLKESGEKIISQTKDIEVPEEMVDIHVSALSFAQYAIEMEKYINPNPEDPISDIKNMSNISGLINNMISFTSQVENKLSEYDLNFENDVKKKIEDMGITAL